MADLKLEIGHTYYMVTYADRHLTMPQITPLVYVGDSEHGNGRGHAFQDSLSYVHIGLRQGMREGEEGVDVY